MADTLLKLRSTKATHADADDEAFIIKKSAIAPSLAPLARSIPVVEQHDSIPPDDRPFDSDDLLRILRSQPDIDTLTTALEACTSDSAHRELKLDLKLPGPLQAQIINTLVSTTIPDFWILLDSKGQRLLSSVLWSVAGINTLLAFLKRATESSKTGSKSSNQEARIVELLQVLGDQLSPVGIITKLWTDLQPLRQDRMKYDLAWKEAVNVLGSGRILAVQVEAFEVITTENVPRHVSANTGTSYAQWLAVGIMEFVLAEDEATRSERIHAAAQLLTKALSLGYNPSIIASVVQGTISADCSRNDGAVLTELVHCLPASSKRRFIEGTLLWHSDVFTAPELSFDSIQEASKAVSGIVRLYQVMIGNSTSLREYFESVISEPALSAINTLTVKRALITLLANDQDCDFGALLETQISRFGDQLFIDHAPMLQQESLAQTILVTAGYLHRKRSLAVSNAVQRSRHMQGTSNRLGCSSQQVRWLGMLVATGLSRVVDKQGAQMNFHTDDMTNEKAKAWLGLLDIDDKIGTLNDFSSAVMIAHEVKYNLRAPKPAAELPLINGKQTFGPPRPPAIAQTEIEGARIAEIDDDADLDELKPYAKPDSDPEDSDEDATLVNRNKAKPPVYIRTLMSMLRDTENADRFQLALKHAAPLIRRKTGHGQEVGDHAEELARILANLQDTFETDNYDELRLQALLAIIISDVAAVAPWVARQAFTREYSISQRCVLLTALGLSGRELAGLDDYLNPKLRGADFPTKQLPSRLRAIYDRQSSQSNVLEATSRDVEQSMIQPMALAAADQVTSHLDAVKVRKFSNRRDTTRTKPGMNANKLAKQCAVSYLFPLLRCLQSDIAAYGDSSACLGTPAVLTTYLRTVALLLHASGPATLDLQQITIEFWAILLYLRVRAVADITIMEAVLFSLLTLLEVNSDMNSTVTDNGKQLMETKEWAEMVFERTGGGNLIEEAQSEESRIRTLCAGVLTKVSEIISSYQNTLMGTS